MDPIKEILQKMQGKLDAAKEATSAEERAQLMDEFDALKQEKEAILLHLENLVFLKEMLLAEIRDLLKEQKKG